METAEENTLQQRTTDEYRCGIITLSGRANTGKSTLMNALLGEKVSIVSPVAQTTRNMVRGILSEPRGQLVLMDTPGIHQASSPLGKIMNRSARSAIEGADAAMLVIDRSMPPRAEDIGWIKRLAESPVKIITVFNKQDLAPNAEAAYREAWDATGNAERTIYVNASAVTGIGMKKLRDILFENMPIAPPLFPESMLSDFPRRWAIADVIREKLYSGLRDELPHSVAVQIREFDESGDKIKVYADILVERHTQKPIVIGVKGRGLRRVKRAAENEITTWFDKPASISLWVKVEPGWNRNHFLLKQLGYIL